MKFTRIKRFGAGSYVEDAVERCVEVANRDNRPCIAPFNDTPITAFPGEGVAVVGNRWFKTRRRFQQAMGF